ncbi:MAG: UpxY family transcription antiterminator [Deltaproteobacteria bacterium]|nr:UpxY family transcription antiterminator [Deltaproteobacteria bacterium]
MPWYAVHTRSRHEDRAYQGLLLKSFNAFLPRIEVWSRRVDRRKKILVPMFPGYLFIELSSVDNPTKIEVLKTFGVVRILGQPGGSQPVAVPEDKIEDIRRIVQSKLEVQHIQYPRIGEPARIVDGPLKGIEGVVLATDYKRELFVISVELLQRSVAIEVSGFQIAKL